VADPTFQDMLSPGEGIVAQLAGNGPTGTFWQLALTPGRLLAVRLGATDGGRWEVRSRVAGPRGALRFTHFPRTAQSNARLGIDGCGDHIVIAGVDDPALVPQVEAFLRAWGGPVAGGDSLARVDPDLENAQPEDKTLTYLIAAAAGLFLLCCGCSGVATVVRFLASAWLGV
jgi:hypothetical protein